MYEQTSLLSPEPTETTPPQEPPIQAPAVKDPTEALTLTKPHYYPIDEATARRGHEMMSFRDYPTNSATDSYRAAVDEAAALVEQKKGEISPFYHGKLDAYLDSYARRLAQWTNDYNRNKASCPSVMISGGSNFPVRKKRKQNAREDSLWQEYKTIEAILDKIKSIGTGPVDLTDPHARDILTDQLRRQEGLLEWCKGANAYYRKHKTLRGYSNFSDEAADQATDPESFRISVHSKPFPDYELTSIRGKIKRIQGRIAELDKLQQAQANPDPATDYDGFQLIRNAAENRLQIVFDEIPSPEMREKLKSHGFRWSPRNSAWQRQLTDNTERAAKNILGIE